jgi:predicted small integral membrane protein
VPEGKTDERVERNDSARKLPNLRAIVEAGGHVPIRGKRRGFLPFETNPFDRVFVSIVLMVAIHLLWMRFLEEYITLTVATILTLILSAFIITRG